MNIIFIGTPDFGLPSLKALIKDTTINVAAVIAQPDKPIGRKQVITSPPIKQEAERNSIPVLQPQKIKTIAEDIKALKPDFIVVAAYAQIIPQLILDIPKYGCINVHGSLLPRYRGASCVQAAIQNGDKSSGVTIMQMDAGLDTGPILAQKSVDILPDWTSADLYDKISLLGAEIIVPTLKAILAGSIKPQKQSNAESTYAPMLKKSDGLIDFKKSALELERFIRAVNPWPGAHINNQTKILETDLNAIDVNTHNPGDFFVYNNKLALQCAKNALVIKSIQPSGKKPLTGEQYINGYKMASSSNG